MDWNSVLTEVAERLETPGLALDGNGRAAVLCDGWLRIGVERAPYGLAVSAPVGTVTDFAREDILQGILAANLPGGGLGAARLGSDGESVVLHLAIPAGLGADAIVDGLESFVASAEIWRKRLDAPRTENGI